MDGFDTALDVFDGRTYGEEGFRFEYDPGTIRFGRGCVTSLADELERIGASDALVVTGTNIGATDAVMDPIRDGLGDLLAGEFAETTPAARLGTAAEAAQQLAENDADAFVAVGGGSSLDVTKAARLLASGATAHEEAARQLAKEGAITVSEEADLPPAVVVPTTLAGAALSPGAGIAASPETDPVDEPVGGGITDARLMPNALFYDPDLYATTPSSVLAGSAMNGLNKAVESLYAASAAPVTDAVAVHGLRLCRQGFPALGGDDPNPQSLERAVLGVLLARYGTARPDGHTLSIIHAFGHALSGGRGVHQGRAHAAVTPAVLRYLFENVDGRRDLLGETLGPAADEEHDDPAEAAIAGVTAIRDAIGLPERIRDLNDHPERDELDDVARAVVENPFVANAPPELDPTAEEIRKVLDAAW